MKWYDWICCTGLIVAVSIGVYGATSKEKKVDGWGDVEAKFEFVYKQHTYIRFGDGANAYVVHAGHCQVRHY